MRTGTKNYLYTSAKRFFGKRAVNLASLFLVSLLWLSVLVACGETATVGSVSQNGAVTATVVATTSNPTTLGAVSSTTTSFAPTELNTTPPASTTFDLNESPTVTTTTPDATTSLTNGTPQPIVGNNPDLSATPGIGQTSSAPTVSGNNPSPSTKAANGQTRTFNEKDNGTTIQISVGDTLMPAFGNGLDWSFQINPPSTNVLSSPATSAKTSPSPAYFVAQGSGTVVIRGAGRCHQVTGKACFNAIIAFNLTVVVN